MPGSDLINKVAQAMKAKREELLAQPISRIWDDLATVAIDVIKDEMNTPSEQMGRSMNQLMKDAVSLGQGWVRFDKDGTVSRIDLNSIYKDVGETNE